MNYIWRRKEMQTDRQNTENRQNIEGGQIQEPCPICVEDGHQCRRCAAYHRLPKWRWAQAFITYVSGVPHPGQKPLFKNTKTSVLATHYLMLGGSVLSAALMTCAWIKAEPSVKVLLGICIQISAMITAGRLRACRHFILHHASHDDFGPQSRTVGECASLIAGTTPFDEYKPKHMLHHAKPAEAGDPELDALMKLNFAPGRTLRSYCAHLWWVMSSPYYLAMHMWGRYETLFAPSLPLGRRIVAFAIHGVPPLSAAILSAVLHHPLPLIVYIIAWYLPWSVGFFVSQILYTLGLHLWYIEPEAKGRAGIAEKTGARFFIDACPSMELPFLHRCLAWQWWGIRFIVAHFLIAKMFTVSGNNQQHDVHHLCPKPGFDWLNSAFDRSRFVLAGRDKYWHTYGLWSAVEKTFGVLAKSQRVEDSSGSTPVELKDALAVLE